MTGARASGLSPDQVVNDIRQHVGHFEANPYMQLGDADSAHQVLFGEMPDGPVAIKPFSVHQRAVREGANLERLDAMGFNALEPLVVARGGLATYLITRRQSGLAHLGQMDWRANVASPRLRRDIAPTLHGVADWLAIMHNAKVVHGDYQAKNSVQNKRGEQVYVDAEKTWINPPAAELTAIGNKDVGLFGVSVLARGLLADRSAAYRAGYLTDELVARYLAAVKADQFTMRPEAREQAIQNYWIGVMQRGHTPNWVRRQLAQQN